MSNSQALWPVRNIYSMIATDSPPKVRPNTSGTFSGGTLKPYFTDWTQYFSIQVAQLPKVLLTLLCWKYSVDMAAAAEGYDFSVGGWTSKIFLRDMLIVVLLGGGWDWLLRLSPLAERNYPHKFTAAKPSDVQMRRDMFWSVMSTLLVSLQEVVLMRWWASGQFKKALFSKAVVGEDSIPWGSDNPFFGSEFTFYFVAWFATVQIWRGVHFYIVHRAIHPWWDRDNTLGKGDLGAVLYRYVHSHHHKSFNPTAWTGISMYPIEATLYLSAALVPTLFRSGCHPFLVLYTKIILIVDAQTGHDGYDKPGAGTYFHQLHHAHFECNYGTVPAPLDWLFGTFEDGTSYRSVKAVADANGDGDPKKVALLGNPNESEEIVQEISLEEVARHTTRDDCWVVLEGMVLDVTEFLSHHPGGEKILLSKAGTDVSKVFGVIHKASGGTQLVEDHGVPQVGVVVSADVPEVADKDDNDTDADAASWWQEAGIQLLLNSCFAALCYVVFQVLMGQFASA